MAKRKINQHGMDQKDLAGAVYAMAHAIKDMAAKLDADDGVTDVDYEDTVDTYFTLGSADRSVLDLEKS